MSSNGGPDGPRPDPVGPHDTVSSDNGFAPGDPIGPAANDTGPSRQGDDTGEKSSLFSAARDKLRRQFGDTSSEDDLERTRREAYDLVTKLQAEMDRLKSDVETERDAKLRIAADRENMRQRLEREKQDVGRFAISKFARDLLAVADTFERAMGTINRGDVPPDSPMAKFLDGIDLTERELHKVFERHGVRRIEAVGERFDPNIHEAMLEIDNPDAPPGTVLQAYEPAYVIEERVLRPAKVIVSRRAPKPVPPTAEEPSVEATDTDAPRPEGTV